MKQLLLLLISSLLLNQLGLFAQIPTNFKPEKMDSLFQNIEASNKAMGSFCLSHQGTTLYQRNFGFRNLKNQQRPDEQTQYRIGSISKTFTAVVILQLVQETKLELQTPIAEFFPKIPKAKQITIEDLLRHRSGIYNFTNDPNLNQQDKLSQEELLNLISKNKSEFEPNSQEAYSNSNYVLLTWIAEKIENKPFAEILQTRIFGPCSLSRTQYASKVNPDLNQALSYLYESGTWAEAPQTDPSIALGAGAISSTPQDLNRFFLTLFQGRLLKPETLAQMQKPLKGAGLGMGLMPFPFHEHQAFGHNGGIDGFQSVTAYFPQHELSLSLSLNAANLSINEVMMGILSICFDKPYLLPQFKASLKVEEKQLKQYEGTYSRADFPLEIKIFIQNGLLVGQASGQAAFPLDCVEEHIFVFDPAQVRLHFNPAKQTMRLQQFTVDVELLKQ